MNKKIKKVTFCIVAFALVFSLLGCSKGDVKITEATDDTKETERYIKIPEDNGCYAEEIYDDCYRVWVENEEEYLDYINHRDPYSYQDDIVAASMDGLRYAIQNIQEDQYGTVILCGLGEEKMIVDFNKMYIPILPEDFYISFVMTNGERNGSPNYKYLAMYGKDVILGGDGNVDFYRTKDKMLADVDDKYDIFSVTIHMAHNVDCHEGDTSSQKREKYVLEEGNKRIVARYDEKNLSVYVIREEGWYSLHLDNFFDHYETLPSDEWFLSFDMVKYIT